MIDWNKLNLVKEDKHGLSLFSVAFLTTPKEGSLISKNAQCLSCFSVALLKTNLIIFHGHWVLFLHRDVSFIEDYRSDSLKKRDAFSLATKNKSVSYGSVSY